VTTTVELRPRRRGPGSRHCRHAPHIVSVQGAILADACRWYAFRVTKLDDPSPARSIEGDVVEPDESATFLDSTRQQAVVEAAI